MTARFRRLLESSRPPTAVPLEVLIVGHTDDVPVTHSRQSHPSNLHLSVHRAIAVRNALVNSGVTPDNVRVAGDGEFHPLVANTSGGTAENRRVEIYLVPAPRGETCDRYGGRGGHDDPERIRRAHEVSCGEARGR